MNQKSMFWGVGMLLGLSCLCLSCGSVILEASVDVPAQRKMSKSDLTQDCVNICGPGFRYDRPGSKRGGREQVCTRYPYDCGYACTTGWDFEYLKGGTEYTCQTAIQNPPRDVVPVQQVSERDLRTQDCVDICGPGFRYDRPGAKLDGREQVCTRYPYDCGYACTTGWNFEYLKDGTEYTCQTAIQQP